MKIECAECDYYYTDDIMMHEGPTFTESLFGKSGSLLLHNVPFIILKDRFLQCPKCNNIFSQDFL